MATQRNKGKAGGRQDVDTGGVGEYGVGRGTSGIGRGPDGSARPLSSGDKRQVAVMSSMRDLPSNTRPRMNPDHVEMDGNGRWIDVKDEAFEHDVETIEDLRSRTNGYSDDPTAASDAS